MIQTADLTTAIEHALRAPSVHNSQPWLWRIRGAVIELHADGNRHLVATDPDRRDLVLSCGAALHHLQAALAAAGHSVEVERMPDPENSEHLATVSIRPGPGDRADAELAGFVDRRRTDRRQMSHRSVPPTLVQRLVEQAHRAGAVLIPVTTARMRQRLATALTDAAERQRSTPGYAAELQAWTHRYAGGHDGVPTGNVAPPATGLIGPSPLRHFPDGHLRRSRQFPGHGPADDAAELLVIVTGQDSPLDWIRAGEASSAVLLAATGMGLATTPLSQAFENAASRREIQQDVLRIPEHPQLILRVGWPVTDAPDLPATPRRDLRSVLLRT
jgi:nitroreductase